MQPSSLQPTQQRLRGWAFCAISFSQSLPRGIKLEQESKLFLNDEGTPTDVSASKSAPSTIMRAIMLVLLTCAASAAYNVVPQRANAHYTNIVRAAQREVSVADELPLTPSYVAFTLAFNLAAHVVGSNEAALAMSLPPVTLFTHGLERQPSAVPL